MPSKKQFRNQKGCRLENIAKMVGKKECNKNKSLKGHGNEADFLGFFQKLVPHKSLTLPFEPF
jgi:hypothetical protein